MVQADDITGDFSSISANVAGLRSCEEVNAVMDRDATSYSVLVTVDDRACGRLSVAAIAGIAVGGALLVLVAIAIPVCFRQWKENKRVETRLQGLNDAL